MAELLLPDQPAQGIKEVVQPPPYSAATGWPGTNPGVYPTAPGAYPSNPTRPGPHITEVQGYPTAPGAYPSNPGAPGSNPGAPGSNPGAPGFSPAAPVVRQTIEVCGQGCPRCGVGPIKTEYSMAGIILAVLCFPVGLHCCLAMTKKKCFTCGTIFKFDDECFLLLPS